MVRKTALTVCLMACCGWCLAIVAGDEGNKSSAYKPVVSVASLMAGQLQHFKKIGNLIHDPSAKDRKENLSIEAEVLAELANVNSFNSTNDDYRAWASQLRDAAMKLSMEAKGAADNAKMTALHRSMKRICGDCHDSYQ